MHPSVVFALYAALTLPQPAPTDSVIWLPLDHSYPFYGPEGWPSWSPDGQQVAFKYFSYTPPQYFDANLEILNRDGTLHHCPIEPLPVTGRAAWSPIGNEIAINGTGVTVMAPDDCRYLRVIVFQGVNPSWSRDGYRVAFESAGWVMTASVVGADLQSVARGEQPDWSPDGGSIVFVREGNLWTVSVDGTNERRITQSGLDEWPSWSPVGHLIAFTRRRDPVYRHADIWIIADGGGEATRITPVVEGEDRERACWSWDGNRLAYFVLSWKTSGVGIGILDGMTAGPGEPVQSGTWSAVKRAYR